MHETSLVRSLLLQVEQIAAQHVGAAVTRVEVEIGPLSGVEPLLVRSAFDRLVDRSRWPSAELAIEEVSLGACCRSCAAEFAIEDFAFRCPECASPSVRITSGDQFRLLNVTIETPQPMESSA
jgi:hydrogenase nickel incorporation protein HypA/HybF